MRIPDPKANTTTEAYLAYKAGYLEESELKSKLYKPDWHFDGWLAYWAGLTNTYPLDENGDPEMLCDEEALVAYLSGVTDTYPEEIKNPYDVRIVGYLKHLAAKRWPEPDYPVNNEEFYLSTMEPTHTSNPTPSADIELDTSEGKIISVEAYGDTFQQTYSGKNLLNTSNANTTTVNGVTSYRSNGVYYLSGTNTKTNAAWVLPNTQNTNLPTFEIGQTYTMSFKGTMPNGIYAQLNAVKTSTGTQYNLGTIRNTVPSATFTIDSDYSRTAQLFIGVMPAATNVDCNFAIQIEKGSTATSYEPYTGGQPSPSPDYPQEVEVVTGNVEVTISNNDNSESKTLPVSLGNIELCKIDNYQDYLYKSNGKWYKYNAINKMVLNGSEIWGLQSINSYGIANFQKSQSVDTIPGQANLSFCDTFSPQTTLISAAKDVGYFLNTAKVLFIRFDSSIANTAATFRTWLSQHNVTFYYVLGTARSTEITDSTLIAQLNALAGADTYDEKTYIKVTANDPNLPALLKVEAYKY